MKTEKAFTITCPPGSVILSLAAGIVYGTKVGFLTLAFFFLIGTIMENRR